VGFCVGLVELEDVIQGHFFLCQLVQKLLSYSFCKFEVSSTKTGVTVLSQMTTGRQKPMTSPCHRFLPTHGSCHFSTKGHAPRKEGAKMLCF